MMMLRRGEHAAHATADRDLSASIWAGADPPIWRTLSCKGKSLTCRNAYKKQSVAATATVSLCARFKGGKVPKADLSDLTV